MDYPFHQDQQLDSHPASFGSYADSLKHNCMGTNPFMPEHPESSERSEQRLSTNGFIIQANGNTVGAPGTTLKVDNGPINSVYPSTRNPYCPSTISDHNDTQVLLTEDLSTKESDPMLGASSVLPVELTSQEPQLEFEMNDNIEEIDDEIKNSVIYKRYKGKKIKNIKEDYYEIEGSDLSAESGIQSSSDTSFCSYSQSTDPCVSSDYEDSLCQIRFPLHALREIASQENTRKNIINKSNEIISPGKKIGSFLTSIMRRNCLFYLRQLSLLKKNKLMINTSTIQATDSSAFLDITSSVNGSDLDQTTNKTTNDSNNTPKQPIPLAVGATSQRQRPHHLLSSLLEHIAMNSERYLSTPKKIPKINNISEYLKEISDMKIGDYYDVDEKMSSVCSSNILNNCQKDIIFKLINEKKKNSFFNYLSLFQCQMAVISINYARIHYYFCAYYNINNINKSVELTEDDERTCKVCGFCSNSLNDIDYAIARRNFVFNIKKNEMQNYILSTFKNHIKIALEPLPFSHLVHDWLFETSKIYQTIQLSTDKQYSHGCNIFLWNLCDLSSPAINYFAHNYKNEINNSINTAEPLISGLLAYIIKTHLCYNVMVKIHCNLILLLAKYAFLKMNNHINIKINIKNELNILDNKNENKNNSIIGGRLIIGNNISLSSWKGTYISNELGIILYLYLKYNNNNSIIKLINSGINNNLLVKKEKHKFFSNIQNTIISFEPSSQIIIDVQQSDFFSSLLSLQADAGISFFSNHAAELYDPKKKHKSLLLSFNTCIRLAVVTQIFIETTTETTTNDPIECCGCGRFCSTVAKTYLLACLHEALSQTRARKCVKKKKLHPASSEISRMYPYSLLIKANEGLHTLRSEVYCQSNDTLVREEFQWDVLCGTSLELQNFIKSLVSDRGIQPSLANTILVQCQTQILKFQQMHAKKYLYFLKSLSKKVNLYKMLALYIIIKERKCVRTCESGSTTDKKLAENCIFPKIKKTFPLKPIS